MKTLPLLSADQIAIFWGNVEKTSSCWNWIGWVTRWGYGSWTRRHWRVHRIAWMLEHGADPLEQLVLHRCDNKRCVRPDHLFLGTQADNIADKVSKGRQAKGRSHGMYGRGLKGEANGFACLTWDAVKDMRNRYQRYNRQGGCTLKVLAQQYGVAEGTVSNIVRNKGWIANDTR